MSSFLLNQNPEPIALQGIDPNMTVLQFLRATGRVGTKEGCASGDCGACTAVVIDLSEDEKALDFKSLNTCIALVHSLSGKCLVTVEGLQQDKKLHPVQQAMVDCHGSQCGYCTPGFIMSMYAWFVTHNTSQLEEIEHSLGGNLCRCTGYQPIIESCQQAIKDKPNYQDPYANKQTHQRLLDFRETLKSATIVSEEKKEQFYAPETLTEVSELIEKYPTARIIAGGTDLGLELTLFARRFEKIISLQNVKELKVITEQTQSITINAGVTIKQALPTLLSYFPSTEQYLYRFAATQIRNWATICGNIANASPIGDFPPLFFVLGARLLLRKGDKERELAIEDYFIRYKQTALQQGEFIKSIIIPKLLPQEKLFVHKLSKRFEDDISAVSLAIKISLQAPEKGNYISDIAIAFGGMAEVPKKAEALSQLIIKRFKNQDISHLDYASINNVSAEIVQAIASEFSPLSDMRASASYRLAMAKALVQRSLLQLAENSESSETSLFDFKDE
jgi:xanthine dehydrogenase small subunit